MKQHDLDQTLRETLAGAAPAEVHERTERYFQSLAAQVRTLEARRVAPEPRPVFSRWLWPGLSLAGAGALALLIFSMLFSSTVSWAQVVERFRTLPYFGVTVYFAPNPAAPPEKIEIWATHDHRTRVHCRGLIIFGRGDEPVKIVRAETGEEIPLAELQAKDAENAAGIQMALHMQERLNKMPNFSLDELLGVFSGKRQDLRPVPNVDARYATDLEVFDLTSKVSPEWIRLWVLKKSQLPVRIRSFDPRQGGQVEAVFDYFSQMPDEAFDPAKVQASLRQKQGGANKLYALLQDPGGRPLTPEALFAQSGMHLPELASVGRTSEGVLWVLSNHGVNRRADGSSFSGWGKLTDDLGQEYLCVWTGQRVDEKTAEYFVPIGYRSDYRTPASYTLTCWDRENHWRSSWRERPTVVVGSVELKQWAENAPMPDLFNGGQVHDADDFLRRLLSELVQIEDWERFDKVAATIPGAPEASSLARYRDVLLAQKLEKIRQHDQAVALRAQLVPLITDLKTATWEETYLMKDYYCDLVRAGQRDAARPLANRFIAELPKDREFHIGDLLLKLQRAGLEPEELKAFFDEDLFHRPRVKEDLDRAQFFQRVDVSPTTSPRFAAWRGYVSELGARYATRALPPDMEFLAADLALAEDQSTAPLSLPGHPEYRVSYFAAGPIHSLAYSTAAYRALADLSLLSMSPLLKGDLPPAVCVYKAGLDGAPLWHAYLKHNNVEVIGSPAKRKVLVARYDGRKLPNSYRVPSLDCSGLVAPLLWSCSGAERNYPSEVLRQFASALNGQLPEQDPQRRVLLNETGLPDDPAPGQSAANVGLAYEVSFWLGTEADQMAFDWFRENFGITFQDEERELTTYELRPLGH